jgi:hypothetical protein
MGSNVAVRKLWKLVGNPRPLFMAIRTAGASASVVTKMAKLFVTSMTMRMLATIPMLVLHVKRGK